MNWEIWIIAIIAWLILSDISRVLHKILTKLEEMNTNLEGIHDKLHQINPENRADDFHV